MRQKNTIIHIDRYMVMQNFIQHYYHYAYCTYTLIEFKFNEYLKCAKIREF